MRVPAEVGAHKFYKLEPVAGIRQIALQVQIHLELEPPLQRRSVHVRLLLRADTHQLTALLCALGELLLEVVPTEGSPEVTVPYHDGKAVLGSDI